jgi:hypothetical protein
MRLWSAAKCLTTQAALVNAHRAIHLPRTSQLRRAGLALLPSFGRPHYTIRLDGADPAGLTRLLDALGPAEANKYHRRERPGRR